MLAREDADTEELFSGRNGRRQKTMVPALGREAVASARKLAGIPAGDLADLIQDLTTQMHAAAADLQFEVAARLRDEISDLKKELRQMVEASR